MHTSNSRYGNTVRYPLSQQYSGPGVESETSCSRYVLSPSGAAEEVDEPRRKSVRRRGVTEWGPPSPPPSGARPPPPGPHMGRPRRKLPPRSRTYQPATSKSGYRRSGGGGFTDLGTRSSVPGTTASRAPRTGCHPLDLRSTGHPKTRQVDQNSVPSSCCELSKPSINDGLKLPSRW